MRSRCRSIEERAGDAVLETVAEQSKFVRTGHYDEVQRLCEAFAQTWPDAVECVNFGRTPEGRPMLALVASRSGALTPEAARKRGLPVMLMQGGIHAGEIDGKDAGFLALRELLKDGNTLRNFVLVFVPVFNVDGHERFGRWNRPNQVGPEEMGWRATAQNLNLNRDYMKADAPEMRAMLGLLNAWDPVLYVDMHVTDGANFQPDVSNTIDPLYSGDPALHPTAKALVTELNSRIAALGSHPLDFYPEFVKEDDPDSGFAVNVYSPRYSTAYWGLHNRFALLLETHSWKDYATRVRVTHNIIMTLADMMSAGRRRVAGTSAGSRRPRAATRWPDGDSGFRQWAACHDDRLSRVTPTRASTPTSRAPWRRTTTRRSRRCGTSPCMTRSFRRSLRRRPGEAIS